MKFTNPQENSDNHEFQFHDSIATSNTGVPAILDEGRVKNRIKVELSPEKWRESFQRGPAILARRKTE